MSLTKEQKAQAIGVLLPALLSLLSGQRHGCRKSPERCGPEPDGMAGDGVPRCDEGNQVVEKSGESADDRDRGIRREKVEPDHLRLTNLLRNQGREECYE